MARDIRSAAQTGAVCVADANAIARQERGKIFAETFAQSFAKTFALTLGTPLIRTKQEQEAHT
jgi:hypothetical protein